MICTLLRQDQDSLLVLLKLHAQVMLSVHQGLTDALFLMEPAKQLAEACCIFV